MQIRCLKCKQEFDIPKEQLKKINEIKIGIMKPKDYLRFFPLISGECKDDKGHAFVFTDKFSDSNKMIVQEYDDICKRIVELKIKLNDINNVNDKLNIEREQINKRLDEIRDIEFANGQKINDISLISIPERESELSKILDSFEELCGTIDMTTWRDVVIPKTTIVTSEEAKKEDKK